jgi:hypothetical protein
MASSCGSYLEVHRPFDPQIITSLNLNSVDWVVDKSGLKVINLVVSQLCAGSYHIWLVYRSRLGNFLKGVKTFYVTQPSCNCN